jgi:D-alanyl-D-alanine carboxypeptidase/D-alanyl-D-alanine-endopeptidase (penicillin-binding protein 4)
MIKPILFVLLNFISFLFSMLYAQSALENTIQSFAKDPIIRHGQLGICIADAETGQLIASHNAQMTLMPASNMKIITTAAALQILGSNYRFKTELQYDGAIKDSILTGNVYIKGYGDPTLGSPEMMDSVLSFSSILDAFALKIKALGIKKIVGKIVGDGTAFSPDMAEPTWLYEDVANYYGAGANGLNLHENLFYLRLYPAMAENMKPSILSITPDVPHLQCFNGANTQLKAEEEPYLVGIPYVNQIYLKGNVSMGSSDLTLKGALPDPPYFAAWQLHRRLKWMNVEITDSVANQLQVQIDTAVRRNVFYTHYSPTLAKIVVPANQESINLYCEAMMKTIAFEKMGFGSTEKGIKIILQFWRDKGIDTEGLLMMDGSGLSPRNGITPLQLVTILRTIQKDSLIFPTFFESLPRPGESGTMRHMMKKTEAIGRLRAKSGTLTRVKCYSGYVSTLSGKQVVFSAMANNFTGSQREIRKKLEQLMLEICKL